MTDQEDFEPKAPYLEELDSESHVRAWAAKGAYSEVLGPDGTWSLPHELADTLEEREELVEYGPDVGDGELNEGEA